MRSGFAVMALLAGVVGAAQGAWAQLPVIPFPTQPLGVGDIVATTPIAPFALTGYIEEFHIAPQAGADLPHAGGTITVNGTTVVIPDNTVIVMPASQLTVYDVFNLRPRLHPGDPGGIATNISGLALKDPPPYTPQAPFEVSITGNVIGGKFVAGLITMAQELAMAHQGYVTNIDYTTGDFCVRTSRPPPGGTPPQPGCRPGEVRLKLNDPVGRFGKKRTDQDPRFVVDDGNPTIRTATGYPMCIPRLDPRVASDPLCPRNNRPIDPATRLPLTRFVMDVAPLPPVVPGAAPIAGATDIPPCPACDSTQQMPVMVGDNITFNGTLSKDAKGSFISVWQFVDTLGAFTKPCGERGTNPLSDPTGAVANNGTPNGRCNPLKDITYIEWETAEVGTEGRLVDGIFMEGQDRIKVVGFTTDPTSEVEIYAITSNPHNRAVAGSGDPLQDGNLRWIANVVTERIPFGRFTLFVQRQIIKNNVPVPSTAGLIPIVDDHLGTDFGAPRQFFVHVAGTEARLAGKQRPHNVKPDPFGVPSLNGTPVPTPSDLVDANGRVVTIANGLVPSQYFQPVQTYVTPESVQVGDPLTANNFECMDFLVHGWNLTTPSFPHGITMGRLNPWPGGLPTDIGLGDGAVPPSQVRCASIVPPEARFIFFPPPLGIFIPL